MPQASLQLFGLHLDVCTSLHAPLRSRESTNPQQATPGPISHCEVGLAAHGHIPMWPLGAGHWKSIPWILRQRGIASPTPLGSQLGSTQESCETTSCGNPGQSLLLWSSRTQLSTGHMSSLNLQSTPMCTCLHWPPGTQQRGDFMKQVSPWENESPDHWTCCWTLEHRPSDQELPTPAQ